MLTSRERVIRAFCLEEPDRVPFGGEGIARPTADVILNRPCVLEMAGVFRRLKLWAEGRVKELQKRIFEDAYEIAKKVNLDFYRLPGLVPSGKDLKPKILTPTTWTFDGETVCEYLPGSAQVKGTDYGRWGGKTVEDFENYVKQLEEQTDSEIEDSLERMQEYKWLMKRFEDELQIAVYGYGAGGFIHQNELLPTFIKCCYVRPDLIRRYEEQQIRRGIKTGSIAIELGCEVVQIGSDIAYNHGPMINPKHYHELIMPYMRMQADRFHRKGAFVQIASDGNLWPIIDDFLIGTGVDGQHEIQANVMDRWKLKERFGEEICFVGNVDVQRILTFGNTEDVMKETEDCIRALSSGGGHILASSNSINQAVKPENFFAMLKTCRKYGVYNR